MNLLGVKSACEVISRHTCVFATLKNDTDEAKAAEVLATSMAKSCFRACSDQGLHKLFFKF